MLCQEKNQPRRHVVNQHCTDESDLESKSIDQHSVDGSRANALSKRGKPQISVFDLDETSSVDAASLASFGYQVHRYVSQRAQGVAVQARISALLNAEASRSTPKPLAHDEIGMTADVSGLIERSQISMVFSEAPVSYDLVNESHPLSHLSQLIGEALKQKTDYHLIIYRADLLPGITENTLIPMLEAASEKRCGEDFGVCVVPCFFSKQASIFDYYSASKTIIGGNDTQATTFASNLYKAHLSSPVMQTSLRNAESVKFIESSWRAMKQTFKNEIERVCRAANIDAQQVRQLCITLTDSHHVASAESGFGYGSTELDRDLNTIGLLSKQHCVDLPLIENLPNSYDAHIDYAVETIHRHGRRKVGILANTSTLNGLSAGSSLYELTQRLEKLGYEVQIYDPTRQDLDEPTDLPDESTIIQNSLFHKNRCDSLEEFIRYNDIVVQTSEDALFTSCEARARLQSTVINLVGSNAGGQQSEISAFESQNAKPNVK